MFQIGNTIISLDVVEKKFECNLSLCKGSCCIEGDAGAPLDDEEIEYLSKYYLYYKEYLQPEAVKIIEEQGFAVKDSFDEWVTPLIDNKECAYAYFKNGIAGCAIEKSYIENRQPFRKPISCWLYPLRITKYNNLTAIKFHSWEICKSALDKGKENGTLLYEFLKEPLVYKFGQEWYTELKQVAKEWNNRIRNKV